MAAPLDELLRPLKDDPERSAVLLDVDGVLAIGGSLAGVAIANAVPQRSLEYGFAALLVFTAYQVTREALDEEGSDDGDRDG